MTPRKKRKKKSVKKYIQIAYVLYPLEFSYSCMSFGPFRSLLSFLVSLQFCIVSWRVPICFLFFWTALIWLARGRPPLFWGGGGGGGLTRTCSYFSPFIWGEGQRLDVASVLAFLIAHYCLSLCTICTSTRAVKVWPDTRTRPEVTERDTNPTWTEPISTRIDRLSYKHVIFKF